MQAPLAQRQRQRQQQAAALPELLAPAQRNGRKQMRRARPMEGRSQGQGWQMGQKVSGREQPWKPREALALQQWQAMSWRLATSDAPEVQHVGLAG